MNSQTEELYKTKCRFNKECTPEPKLRKYQGGAIHYVTQCSICGCSFGQPFAKSLMADSIEIKPFDEKLEDLYFNKFYKESIGLSEKQLRLQEIRKQLKVDFFKNTLKLPCDSFEVAHSAYLNSDAWEKKRQIILKRDNHTCQFCKLNRATQVHHLSYDNLGNESDFELLSVCRECHQIIHAIENNESIYDRSQRKLF